MIENWLQPHYSCLRQGSNPDILILNRVIILVSYPTDAANNPFTFARYPFDGASCPIDGAEFPSDVSYCLFDGAKYPFTGVSYPIAEVCCRIGQESDPYKFKIIFIITST